MVRQVYVICHTLEEVAECKEKLAEFCAKLNIIINEKKLRVSKLSKTFIFLKKRFFLSPTGKVVKKIGKETVTRCRRRLVKLTKKALEMPEKYGLNKILDSYNSSYGNLEKFQNFELRRNYRALFLRLLRKYDNQIKERRLLEDAGHSSIRTDSVQSSTGN